MSKTLGTIITEGRKRKGLSQEKFAEQIKCTRQMVSRWELDEAKPRTENIKKISEVLEIPIEELMGNQKKEKNEKSDISNNSNSIKVRKINFLKIFIIIGIIFVIIGVSYLGYSGYKYAILNKINAKVAEYMKVNNYYCKKGTFINKERQISTEIWYKDGLYKIIETTYFNGMENSTIKYVNLNNKCLYIINEKEKTYLQMILSDVEDYNDGKYMYSLYPIIIQEEAKGSYKELAMKMNKIYCKIDNENLVLKVNDEMLYLNKDNYLPVMDTIVLKENNNKQENRDEFIIELNNVKDEDVTIPSSYTKVE